MNYYNTTSYSPQRALNYNDIILRHNKGTLSSRTQAKISVDFGRKTLATPVILANVSYIQRGHRNDILKKLDYKKWGYIYHRLDGDMDIIDFIEECHNTSWNLISISVGVKESDRNLLKLIKERKYHIDWLTIDVAFSWTTSVLEFVRWVRQEFPNVFLIVGNLSEEMAARELAYSGVDCVKCGIGVSASCRTRQFTGFGSTTITSLQEIKSSLDELFNARIINNEGPHPVKIMQDGGLSIINDEVSIGDVFKALNFGADVVLSASIFGRVKELADKDENVLIYGNSTARAKGYHANVEGSEFFVKAWDRTLEQQMKLIEDSLRSSCSYAGIYDIKDAYGSCGYYLV